MPLARSNTGRSQSRSPFPLNSSSRPFLPPSHYAAAAGITYDENKHVADHAKDNYPTAFMPAYQDESNSESSFEFKPSSVREEKPPVPPKSNRRSRRESLLNDLPQLEANLLPSLRDTIDRMTKSPGQQEPASTSHLSIPRPSGASRSSRSLSPSYASRENPAKCITPEPYSPGGSSAILTPRTNTPARPPPKSMLRPPAPKLPKVPTDSPPGPVRSILKNIPKRDATPSPIPENGMSRRSTLSIGSKPPIPPSRSRSRTDPGTVPTVVSFADQYSTPRIVGSTDQPTPRVQPSAIPRLRSKRSGTGTYWSTDDSDADVQYEPRGRDRCQPPIARAHFQSGSESEVDRKKGNRHGLEVHDGNFAMVGLGIGLEAKKETPKIGLSRQTTAPSRTEIVPQSTRRMTGNRSPARPRSVTNDSVPEHNQRREALLNIVSRLNLDKSGDSDSEYHGEEGVAISGSQDLSDLQSGYRQEQASEVDSDYEQNAPVVPRVHKERPRSASHTPTPTFLLSPNPDDQRNISPSCTPHHSKRHLGPPPTPNHKAHGQPQHESSSRSPVVPQIDTATIPAALRRHSVYHRAANPNVHSPVTNMMSSNTNDDKRTSDRQNSGPGVPKAQRGSSWQRREAHNNNVNADANVHLYAAAARERKVYGIPPSNSIESHYDLSADKQSLLSHAESDLSSVGSMYWGDDSESELSPAAETLFRKLDQGKGDRKSYQSSSEKVFRSNSISRTSSPSPPVQTASNTRPSRTGSPRYEDPRLRSRLATPSPMPVECPNTEVVVDVETRRQDIIAEIINAEEDFVKRLQVFVQLFILPLRIQDNKEWIAGIPTEVARLFDWLEDIVILHTQLLGALEATRDAQFPALDRIAEPIRAFIPRLEVYQPYLVHLEDVISLVERLIQEEESDFGEFVHLQEAAPECDGWNFQRFLIEPVNILARFPYLFSRLLELTPKNHRDYMPTFALVHSTEMFIRVMTEVKIREDEYDMIQHFAARIQGLGSSTQLATRERRLLHHGILHLVYVEANDRAAGTSTLFRYFPPDANTTANNRSGKLATAIHQWETTGRGRSGSTSSSSTGVSLSSLLPSSSSASSIFFSSFKLAVPQGRFKPSTVKPPMSPSPAPRGNNAPDALFPLSSTRGTPVQAFVFTDLLLLAAISSACKSDDEWTLLNHIGTTRILDAHFPQESDLQGHDSSSGSSNNTAIMLEVISVDTHKLNRTPNRDLDTTSVFSLRLELPLSGMDNANLELQDTIASKRKWDSALRRCQRFTLCSLSTPTRNHDPQLDVAFDKHQTLFSLLASGLPLPKSPSMQMANVPAGCEKTDDTTTQEREERGWWSLRFQQVFRELLRQDMALAAATDV